MKLTNQQILTLSPAIQSLDGRHETQIVEGKAIAVFKSVKLAHSARWALACNQGKLQNAIADYNRAQDFLIKQYAGGQDAISGAHPKFGEFADDRRALLSQETELDLDQIALADLKLEENENAGNPIPIALLTALEPLIKS
jgi:hypothetical protein